MCTWDVLLEKNTTKVRESIYYVFKKRQPLWSRQFSFTLSQSSFPRDRRVKGQVKASKRNPYAGWVQRIYDACQLVRSNRLTNYQNFTKLEYYKHGQEVTWTTGKGSKTTINYTSRYRHTCQRGDLLSSLSVHKTQLVKIFIPIIDFIKGEISYSDQNCVFATCRF